MRSIPPTQRRRKRRRGFRLALGLIPLAVVVALVWGGVAEVGRASSSFDASSNRSFVAQGRIVALESNRSAAEMRSVVGALGSSTLGRVSVEVRLDALVSQTADQSGRASFISPPASRVAGQMFVDAMELRARAVVLFRSAIDGLLGSTPSTPAGAYARSGGQPRVSPSGAANSGVLIPSSTATARILSAGALLIRSDRDYALSRRWLKGSAGHATLPVSRWVERSVTWGLGPVSALVQDVANSPTLSAQHALALTTVRVDPPAVPALTAPQSSTQSGSAAVTSNPSATVGSNQPTGTGAPSVIPPTSSLAVTAVVDNTGNVTETGVSVTATLQRTGSSRSAGEHELISLRPGGSVAVAFPTFKVTTGDSYTLTVSVSAPDIQQLSAGLTQLFSLQIAPATPSFPTGPG